MPRSEDGGGAPALLWVEARDAAGMLGVSRRAVRDLVAGGDLEGRREGAGAAARMLVSVASVEGLRSGRRGTA